jgi:dipeptidyl aminopeptidase/acylaminoacyl peptidase
MKKQSGLAKCIIVLISFLLGCQATDSLDVSTLPEPALKETSFDSPTEVKLLTSDGVSIKAYYDPPLDLESEAYTLLLLHGAYEDHRSWNAFEELAQAEGYAVLTLDLRGHGQSGGEKTFDESMDLDVEAALGWLENSTGANLAQILLMGESLGASLALRAGARHPEIPAVVLLSPGMQLWEISINNAIDGYGSRPIFLVSSEEDEYPAMTVGQLAERTQGQHELLLLPGEEHGTKMLAANPDLAAQILNWLSEDER